MALTLEERVAALEKRRMTQPEREKVRRKNRRKFLVAAREKVRENADLRRENELLKDVIGRVLQYFPAQLEYKPALLAKMKEIVGCRPPRIGRF